MKRSPMFVLLGLLVLAAPARAQVTFEYLFDGGYPLSVSSDGSVVVGQMAANGDVFRWTQATGPASLGRLQHAGAGGTVGVSADGSRVASSIASLDSSYTTQGLWTAGSGWQELMPPAPPDGGIEDGAYGNVYALSGDGTTVVGLYWRPGAGNRAHASKWTQATGVVDLGGTVTGQASRANGVDYDGSVIAGWVETPTGPWRPAAWVNGSTVLLSTYVGSGGEGRVVSPDGNLIAGYNVDSASTQRAATMWKRSGGTFGPPRVLGWVPGTTPGYGINVPEGISADGRMVVGYCSFAGDPFYTTGFVWTDTSGVIDVVTFLGNSGVYVDPTFTITTLSAMTPDGTQLFGYGQVLTPPYTKKAFRIRVPNLAAAPPGSPVVGMELAAPVPNPSAGGTRIDFGLERASQADLSVFDAAGRRVATLLHGTVASGRKSITWSGGTAGGGTAPAGLYFARLTTEQGTRSRRLVRIR